MSYTVREYDEDVNLSFNVHKISRCIHDNWPKTANLDMHYSKIPLTLEVIKLLDRLKRMEAFLDRLGIEYKGEK